MSTETLIPDGDGTVTGWSAEAGAPIFDSIDDYSGGGAKDDDTTYIVGPNNSDSSCFFTLSNTGASFDPALINTIQIKIAYRKESSGVSGAADTIALSVAITKSDESTTLANLTSVNTNVGTSYNETTVTLTKSGGSQTKADWDAARLRIFCDYTQAGCSDSITKLRVSAVRATVLWTAVVAVGQVTETDTAQAISNNPRRRLILQASETDEAQPIDIGALILSSVVASASGNDVTITAVSSGGSLENARYGVEYGDGVGGNYERSRSVPGAATNQSITIGLDDGVILGHDLSWRVYYNLDEDDPVATRVYFDTGEIFVPTGPLGTLGQASETDTAQAIAWAPKHRLLNQVEEANIAQPIALSGAITLSAISALVVGNDVTITATSSGDLTLARYGVEYGDGAGGNYEFKRDVAGAVASQSITIGEVDGVILGNTLSYRPYYNLDENDPAESRVYGAAAEIFVPAGSLTQVGQASETDTAQAISWAPKARLVNQVSETETAQAISRLKAKIIGQVSETDESQAIAHSTALATGQASETDSAQALVVVRPIVIGQASETDVSQAMARLKTAALAQVLESDQSQAITRAGAGVFALAQASEDDSAQAFAWAPKNRLLNQASETELAQSFGRDKTKALGQASETSTAQSFAILKTLTVNLVLEIDVALGVTGVGDAFGVEVPPSMDAGAPGSSSSSGPASNMNWNRMRRYILPDNRTVFATPFEIEALLRQFTKEKPKNRYVPQKQTKPAIVSDDDMQELVRFTPIRNEPEAVRVRLDPTIEWRANPDELREAMANLKYTNLLDDYEAVITLLMS